MVLGRMVHHILSMVLGLDPWLVLGWILLSSELTPPVFRKSSESVSLAHFN